MLTSGLPYIIISEYHLDDMHHFRISYSYRFLSSSQCFLLVSLTYITPSPLLFSLQYNLLTSPHFFSPLLNITYSPLLSSPLLSSISLTRLTSLLYHLLSLPLLSSPLLSLQGKMDGLKRAVDLMDESAVKLSSARGR